MAKRKDTKPEWLYWLKNHSETKEQIIIATNIKTELRALRLFNAKLTNGKATYCIKDTHGNYVCGNLSGELGGFIKQ